MKKSRLSLIVAIIFLVLALLAVLAPVFAYLGLEFLSDPIYGFFQWFCHQRPWRSYHMFDYQYAIDARMITMFFSIGIGGLLVYYKGLKQLKIKSMILLLLLMLIPMAIDGVTQAIAEVTAVNSPDVLPFYESTNFIRSITGIFAGTGIAFIVFPFLNYHQELKVTNSSIQNYIKPMIITFFATFILIPLMVLLWSVTSDKYKPSSLLIDFEQRFPGYNYEITTGAGHSTIIRVINGPTKLYEQRAKYFEKDEYLKEQKN